MTDTTVNQCRQTAIRRGRGELGHWGEALAAAIVLADDNDGHRWLLMVARTDGHGWAVPGGTVEPGENHPADTAVRTLAEETGLQLPRADWAWDVAPLVYVDDPRASDEAWIVTVACSLLLGRYSDPDLLPAVAGGDDATRAAWIRADSYDELTGELAVVYDGARVCPAHEQLLRDALAVVDVDPSACPNCGAPTGGNPCTRGYGGGPSCADVLAEVTAVWSASVGTDRS